MTTAVHRVRIDPTALFGAAAGCYAANCALGTAVALGALDTSRARWVHHGLYITTCAVTALALSAPLWTPGARRARRGATALAPVIAPLTAIPFVRARTHRHPVLALAAAPFYIAGLLRST